MNNNMLAAKDNVESHLTEEKVFFLSCATCILESCIIHVVVIMKLWNCYYGSIYFEQVHVSA